VKQASTKPAGFPPAIAHIAQTRGIGRRGDDHDRTADRPKAAAPSYLALRGRPGHPRELIDHACIRHRFFSGVSLTWEFEKDGEVVRVVPRGPPLLDDWLQPFSGPFLYYPSRRQMPGPLRAFVDFLKREARG
jgi:DNA-binding transcriptional LysR family regulator